MKEKQNKCKDYHYRYSIRSVQRQSKNIKKLEKETKKYRNWSTPNYKIIHKRKNTQNIVTIKNIVHT